MQSRALFALLTTTLMGCYGPTPALAQIIGPQNLEQLQQKQRQAARQQVAPGTVPGLYYDPSGAVSPSLSQLNPADKPGALTIPSQYQSSIFRELGYDPSRAWAVGSTPDQILKIGDLQQSKYIKIGQMTLRDIAARSGLAIDAIPLSQIALIRNMTVGELYQAYPKLQNIPLKDISFLAKTLAGAARNPEQLGRQALDRAEQRALSELAAIDPRLSDVPLGSILRGDWDQVLSQSQAGAAKLAVEQLAKVHPELVNVPVADLLNGNWNQVGSQVLQTAQKVLLEDLGQNPALKGIPVLQLTQGDWGGSISRVQQGQLQGLLKQYPEIAQLPVDKAFPIVNGVIAGDWQSVSEQALQKGLNLAGDELFQAVPELKNLPLGALPINNLNLKSLPGLADRPLEKLPNISSKYVSQLPGLSQVPVNKLPIDFALSALMGDLFGRLDVAYAGATETPVPNVVTGGTKDQTFTPEPCHEKRCAHFELDNTDGGGPPGNLSGKAWVEGKAQKVEGGKGFLRTINGGKEPTGVPVWGTDAHVKLSLEDIEEGGNGKPSSARIWANFQFCISVPFLGEQCSPHFIPIPTPWQVKEGGMILVASRAELPDFLRQERDRIQSEYGAQYAPDPYCEPGSTIATTTPQTIASTGKLAPGTNVAQQNEQRYLARIAAGESSGGRNTGPNYLGARGWYQFKPQTRQLLMRRRQYRHLDPWSPNKQIQDQAALAWIDLIGKEENVNLRAAIRQGNFRLADRVLGRRQFTSLPGGPEQARIWRNPATLAKYGPAGSIGAGAIPPVYAGQPCPPIADGSGGLPVKSGPINQRIHQAAKQSYGMSSRSGPGGGNVACAWAVNRVLNRAGIRTIGSNPNLVVSVQSALNAGRGTQIANRSQAAAGDLVLAVGGGKSQHIGICMNNGCTRVLSNSSSKASFRWISDTDFGGNYNVRSKIYRVVK